MLSLPPCSLDKAGGCTAQSGDIYQFIKSIMPILFLSYDRKYYNIESKYPLFYIHRFLGQFLNLVPVDARTRRVDELAKKVFEPVKILTSMFEIEILKIYEYLCLDIFV